MRLLPSRGTLTLLRIPFSYYLLPTFLLGLGEAVRPLDPWRVIAVFIALHLFLYPASNGYNSYWDRDEGAIGGLERPPRPTRELLAWTWVFDAVGYLLGFLVDWRLGLAFIVYSLLSKAYSRPPLRLKRFGIFSWCCVALVQGAATTAMAALACGATVPVWQAPSFLAAAGLAGLFLLAGYPVTQVYQHAEDAARGDRTMSLRLGVRGTFILAAVLFALAIAGFVWYYSALKGRPGLALLFVAAQVPVVLLFLSWAWRAWRDPAAADWKRAMRMNFWSTTAQAACFAAALLVP